MAINAWTRLENIADLDSLFSRPARQTANQGGWTRDSGGSTPSSNTGPGTNTPTGSYVFSETSGGGSIADIVANSTIVVTAAIMAQWTGAGRTLQLRASIAGSGWIDDGEGLEIRGRASDSDSWTSIDILEGWAYSANGYVAGGTLTDREGDVQAIAQDGGWVDFEIAIPDTYTQVQVRSMPIASGDIFRHDAALWQVRFNTGTPVGTPVELTPAAIAGGGEVSAALSVSTPVVLMPAAIDGGGTLSAALTVAEPAGTPVELAPAAIDGGGEVFGAIRTTAPAAVTRGLRVEIDGQDVSPSTPGSPRPSIRR